LAENQTKTRDLILKFETRMNDFVNEKLKILAICL